MSRDLVHVRLFTATDVERKNTTLSKKHVKIHVGFRPQRNDETKADKVRNTSAGQDSKQPATVAASPLGFPNMPGGPGKWVWDPENGELEWRAGTPSSVPPVAGTPATTAGMRGSDGNASSSRARRLFGKDSTPRVTTVDSDGAPSDGDDGDSTSGRKRSNDRAEIRRTDRKNKEDEMEEKMDELADWCEKNKIGKRKRKRTMNKVWKKYDSDSDRSY